MTTDTSTDAAAGQPPAAAPEASAEAMAAARGWAMDCDWRESLDYGLSPEEVVDDMTDAEVKRSVTRHYDGGWDGFLRDAGLADQQGSEHEAEVEA